MHPVAQRFLRLVAYDTQSDYDSTSYPSTPSQVAFAKILVDECIAIGLSEVHLDAYGYVTATLPATIQTDVPVIGFLAHMDTSSDAPGASVKPRIVADYDGGIIRLNDERVLSPEEFPHLSRYVGQTLIVTDGYTLLGADDKAGVAEIITAMEYLVQHPEIKHGKIRIAFTPDEEVGRGVDYFDVKAFGAEYAYTVDGGGLGEFEAETFNAARAVFTVTGKSVHPGYAYKTMQNAALIAAEIVSAFPAEETPAETKDYAGFYHLTGFSGEVSEATVSYLLRDFDGDGLEKRKQFANELAERMNRQYGPGTVSMQIKDEYRNMAEILRDKPEIADRVKQAIAKAGITPDEKRVRGGTDGSRLSFMGLPCPNIFTGGHNFHGPYEYIPVPSMEAAVRVIMHICEVTETF